MASADVMYESELLCASLPKNILIFGEEYNDEGSPLSTFLHSLLLLQGPYVTIRNKSFSYDEEFLAPRSTPKAGGSAVHLPHLEAISSILRVDVAMVIGLI
jgi:hypothetical protein